MEAIPVMPADGQPHTERELAHAADLSMLARGAMLIALLTPVYIVLGLFLDGISMIPLTLPVVLPIVKAAGFDPLWFGIFLIICIEMAEISPPVGQIGRVILGSARSDAPRTTPRSCSSA